MIERNLSRNFLVALLHMSWGMGQTGLSQNFVSPVAHAVGIGACSKPMSPPRYLHGVTCELVEDFRTTGTVIIRNAIDSHCMEALRDSFKKAMNGKSASSANLNEITVAVDTIPFGIWEDVYDIGAIMLGVRRQDIVIDERSWKLYGQDTKTQPTWHLDRFSSELTFGIVLDKPPQSNFVTCSKSRAVNYFGSANVHLQMMERGCCRHQRAALKSCSQGHGVQRHYEQPGDILLTRGNSVFHGRAHGAGTWLLTIFVNAHGMSPQGHDFSKPTVMNAAAQGNQDTAANFLSTERDRIRLVLGVPPAAVTPFDAGGAPGPGSLLVRAQMPSGILDTTLDLSPTCRALILQLVGAWDEVAKHYWYVQNLAMLPLSQAFLHAEMAVAKGSSGAMSQRNDGATAEAKHDVVRSHVFQECCYALAALMHIGVLDAQITR